MLAAYTDSQPIFTPEVVLPGQIEKRSRGLHPYAGELQLIKAILDEAILAARGKAVVHGSTAAGRVMTRRREQWRALAWLFDGDPEDVFSFENVCEWLTLNPEAVREQVRRNLG